MHEWLAVFVLCLSLHLKSYQCLRPILVTALLALGIWAGPPSANSDASQVSTFCFMIQLSILCDLIPRHFLKASAEIIGKHTKYLRVKLSVALPIAQHGATAVFSKIHGSKKLKSLGQCPSYLL